jgi:hypothetical protein
VPITTKYVSFNPTYGEVYSVQQYVIKFASDLWLVGDFLWVLSILSRRVWRCQTGNLNPLIEDQTTQSRKAVIQYFIFFSNFKVFSFFDKKDPKLSLSELLFMMTRFQFNPTLFIWPSMWARLEHAYCLETINKMSEEQALR